MCGIAGICCKNPSEGDPKSLVRSMLSKISHRGSESPQTESMGAIHFGHTRLSITGGSTGIQPFVSGDLMVTFNGEIYNYLDIRTDLMRRGFRFKTKSDAEVILHAYRAYGQVFVEKLRGIFAFALYDLSERCLILCRDRVGVKPLYYAQTPAALYFCSEIKGLPSVSSGRIDEHALCEYLTFQFCLEDRTLFQGVQKVRPGEMLVFRTPDLNMKRNAYWSVSETMVRSDFQRYYTEQYYEDKLLSTLHTSVRQQTPSVPFGVYLSGGVDSGTIAALLAEYSDDFKLITGQYGEPGFSEENHAKALAEFIGKGDKFNPFLITEDYVYNTLRDALYHMDEPCAGPGLIGQFALAKMLRTAFPDMRVVVGGQGGDELFGGYARYVVAYLESCIQGAIHPKDRDFVVRLDTISPLMPILRGYEPMLKKFLSSDMFDSPERRYFSLISRFDPKCLSRSFRNDVYDKHKDNVFQAFQQIFFGLGNVSYFTKMTYFDFKASLPALLQVDDRVNGAFELEGRVPLLGEDVVELAFAIPPVYKFSGGYSKGLLRKALAGVLPESVLWRRDKMGFPVPISQWVSQKGKFHKLLTESLTCDLCDTMFNKEGQDSERTLWGKLSIGLWSQIFNMDLK